MLARKTKAVPLALALILAAIVAAAQPAAAQPTTSAEPSTTLEPFAAHYTAEWKTISVGTSDIELKNDDSPGHFIYTWTVTAHGIFRIVYSNDVIQKSWFSVIGDHVRPEKYHAEQGSSTANVDFDWDNLRAHGMSENTPVDLKLSAGIQDVMSIQIEVMLGLKNGNLDQNFKILDKDEIKDFVYTQEGPARIRTAFGVLDTVVVASQRPGNSRILRMWFAPSLGYVPVQAERSRDGKLEFALRIKTLKRAGQSAATASEPPPT